MRSKLSLNLQLIIVLIFFCTHSYAQQRNFNVVKTEPNWLQKVNTVNKKPADRDIQDGYYLFLYEQQNNLETEEFYQHTIREIVSDNGVQNGSEISVTYDPSYQKLSFHKVIIWRDNKPIDKLVAANFKVMQNEKELSKFIYSGTYDAYLILDDTRKGDRIEYSFTIKGSNPVFNHKFSNTFYFDGESQISNIYYNLLVNQERQIQLKNFNTVPPPKTKMQNRLKIYEWQAQLTKTIKSNDYEPSWYNAYGRVQISEHNSWKEIVDWSIGLNQYEISKSGAIASKIKEFQAKAKGNKELYFELATRFVQDQVRYMGIEIGEYSHRPNSPEKVLQQRYGDCKDKSLLLIQLLRGNGINAYPVYVNTYLKNKITEILPTTGAFNHAVVLVEFDGQKIWIDPTISDQGGAIKKNYFPYLASVLVVKPGNDQLELVKPNPQGKLTSIALFKIPDSAGDQKAEVTIKSTYTANYADVMRSEISSDGIDKLEKDFLEYYIKLYPGITKKKDLLIVDDKKNNIISLEENYEIENSWVKEDSASNKYYTYFYGDMINNDTRKLTKARTIPFALKYPSNIHQIVKVWISTGAKITNKDVHINNSGYRFDYTRKKVGDTIVLDYSYENKQEEISAAETQNYVKDYTKISDLISYSISMSGGGKSDDGQSTGLNYSMVILCIFTVIVTGLGCFFIYKHRLPYHFEEIKYAQKIGGWLILAGFGIVFSPIILLFSFSKLGSFNQSTWDGLSTYGDVEIFWKWLLCFEVVVNTFLIIFSALLIILYFKRRKEFPKYYIILRIISFIVVLLDVLFAYILNNESGNEINLPADIVELLKSIVFSTIWIAYFMKSTRVKKTFVFTYPDSEWRLAYSKEIASQINVPFPDGSDISTPPADPEQIKNID